MAELIRIQRGGVSFNALPVCEETAIVSSTLKHFRPYTINILDAIPGELIQQIIFYYTNCKEGLFSLRCLNREWKHAAESSLLWLHCSLTFYCPPLYLRPMKNHTIWNNFEVEDLMYYMKEDITTFLDSYENIETPIGLFQIILNAKELPPTCKVMCDAQQQRKLLSSTYYYAETIAASEAAAALSSPTSSPRHYHQSQHDSNHGTAGDEVENRLPSSPSSPNNYNSDNTDISSHGQQPPRSAQQQQQQHYYRKYNRIELAKQISQWYVTIYRTYQLYWRKEIKKVSYYYYYDSFFICYFEKYIIPSVFTISNLLFALSIYGFTTLQSNVIEGDLGWENHLSFLCIYCICSIYTVLTVLHVLQEWLQTYRSDESLKPRFVYKEKICGYDILCICFIATAVLIGMVHIKVSQMANNEDTKIPNITGHSPCTSSINGGSGKGTGSNSNCGGTSRPEFSWTLTVTPIWVAVVVSVSLVCYQFCVYSLPPRTKKMIFIVLSTLLLTAVSVQLMASFYDNHGIPSMGFADIPLFPIIFALISFGVSMVIYIFYYWFYQGLIFRAQFIKRTMLLFCGCVYTAATIGMIVAIIILVMESFLNYRILIPALSPVGEFALLAYCVNLIVTIHLFLASPKNQLTM